MIKYKAVRRYPDGSLKSINAKDELCVNYVVGKFVKASVGGLLVFSTFGFADQFDWYGGRDYPIEIWSVKVKDEVPKPRWAYARGTKSQKKIGQFWSVYPEQYDCWNHIAWPEGTEAFKYVKLLEKVL
jgi:hypothetical protein